MKLLYIASNPVDSDSLMLEQEITDLQRRFMVASGEPIKVVFLPAIRFEELPLEVSRHKADVLHISAHGDNESLRLANAANKPVELTGPMLRTFLDIDLPPRLVYLNACNSQEIAKDLIEIVPMAIGTTAPITNRAARASAVTFYDRLLQGRTVQHAYEVGRAIIDGLQNKATSSKLYCRNGTNANWEHIHSVPRIVAKFAGDKVKRTANGGYNFELGAVGCPRSTRQVLFFTDDPTFIGGDETVVDSIVSVVMEPSPHGEMWEDDGWYADGDFRIMACGVTPEEQFVISSSLADAVELYYKLSLLDSTLNSMPKDARSALAEIRRAGGSRIGSAELAPRALSLTAKAAGTDGNARRSNAKKK